MSQVLNTQPKLLAPAIAPHVEPGTSADPARRLFEHWAFMHGRSLKRCKLDPARTKALLAMLTLYDEESILLAIDGHAADPMEGWAPRMQAACRELEWLLARGARIEFYAEQGEQLRARVEAEAQAAVAAAVARAKAPSGVEAQKQAEAAAADIQAVRERLRAVANKLRAGR